MAIIAVMVAIAIPTFQSQLEKSREGTDISNIRAAYAEISALALTDPDIDHSASVPLVQTQSGWQTTGVKIANLAITNDNLSVSKGESVAVTYTAGTDGTGTIKIGDTIVTSSFVSGSTTPSTPTAVTLGNVTTTADISGTTITVTGVKALFTSLAPTDATLALATNAVADVTPTGDGITVTNVEYTGDTLTITVNTTGASQFTVSFKATKTGLTDGTGTLTITSV